MRKYKLLVVEDNDEQLKILQDNITVLCSKIEFSEILYADSYAVAEKILAGGKRFDFSILDIFLDEGQTCYKLITDFGVEPLGKPIFNTAEQEVLDTLINLNVFTNAERNRAVKPFFILQNKYSQSSIERLTSELIKYIGTLNNTGTITFKTGKLQKIVVKKEDIVFIQTSKDRDNYCDIHYLSIGKVKVYTQKNTLKYFEGVLDENIFVRVHNQTILNIAPEFIEKIYDETVILKFKDSNNQNIQLPISEKYKERLNIRLG